MPRSCLLATIGWLSLCGVVDAAETAAPFGAQFRAFAAKHCLECHSPEAAEGNLRLDQLPHDFDTRDVAARWVKVLDKMTSGEMPPPDSPRPPQAELQTVVGALRTELHAASAGRQNRDGRVLIRRLNRTEYETTLRDLLGVTIDVRELLPEDGTAAGFDKVSTVLETSATHLLRYQQAAARALPLTLPGRPQEPSVVERRTGRAVVEKHRFFKDLLDKSVRLDGDALVMHVRTWDHIQCESPVTQQAGRYRVRASVRAIGTDGKPLPMMCIQRDLYGADNRMTDLDDLKRRRIRDVRPGEPQVVEFELEMRERSVVSLLAFTLPSPREFESVWKGKPLEEYAGPGLVVEWVELEGPLPNWPPENYRRLYDDVALEQRSVVQAKAEGKPRSKRATPKTAGEWRYDPLIPAPVDARADAARLMRAFLPRAFRRPVEEGLADYYVKLVLAEFDRGRTFVESLHAGYQAALCSPHFLYLTEKIDPTKGAEATMLDDYAIAARLSYFLWSSLPDDELTAAAARGELLSAAGRHEQVERMLADPKARRFTENFAGQWFDVHRLNETSPDRALYGEFDEYLFWSMPQETFLFFEEILKNDRRVSEFTHSDWTFLNERLARHYGIAGVEGGELRKVPLPAGCGRGGVLGHAVVLKVTADGTKTSPILRGKWVLEKILGRPPEPPPPNVPAVEPDIRGATTIRQQLELHRNTAACNACHKHIDPPGFALEAFDVIGGRRDFYRANTSKFPSVDVPNHPGRKTRRGPDVESGGTAADGRTFRDIDEFKRLLLADEEQLVRNVVEKLLTYATGAEIQFADREVVEQIIAAGRKRNFGLRSLIHQVVDSRVFLRK
jgi:hypothetical protein